MGNDNIFWAPGSNHTWSLPCTLQLHKPLDFSICISQFSWLLGLYTLRNPALSFNKSTEFCIFSFVVQLLSHVQLLATPWTTAHQASLSFTISWSLLKLMSNELVMPSNHLLSPSSPAFNLSKHQGVFQGVSSSHQVAKVLELQLQHQSFQWIFRTDFL